MPKDQKGHGSEKKAAMSFESAFRSAQTAKPKPQKKVSAKSAAASFEKSFRAAQKKTK